MKKIDNKAYHDNEALGASLLALLLKNAKKFKMVRDGELVERTQAMDFGSAFHALILEPHKFEDMVIVSDERIPTSIKNLCESDVEVCVYPDEVLTKSGALSTSKAAKEAIEKLDKSVAWLKPKEMQLYELHKAWLDGKILLTSEEYNLLFDMRDKLFKLDKFEDWLRVGVKERSFFGEIDGVKLKCRPDLLVRLANGKYIVIDLKTMTGEATPDEFMKSSANYLYYLQEAVYREVLRQNDVEVVEFIFAGVSKKEHSGANYFKHDYIALEQGFELLQKALFKYKWCNEHNEWREGKFDFVNGGFSRVNEVTLPAYAFYQFL